MLCFPFLLVVCRTKRREKFGSGADLERNHSLWWEVTLRTDTDEARESLSTCMYPSPPTPQATREPKECQKRIKVSRGRR